MKALVGAFNQEKALVGAFSVIVKTDCETDGSFYSTTQNKEVFAEAAAVASPLHPDTLVTRYRPGFLSGPQHYQE